MMNYWYAAAALLSFLTAIVHVTEGGKDNARPLLADDNLNEGVKFTLYYCWHIVTIAILLQALSFGWASLNATDQSLAMFATWEAALFAGASLTMIWRFGLSPWKFPQWVLFMPIAVLGFIGSWL